MTTTQVFYLSMFSLSFIGIITGVVQYFYAKGMVKTFLTWLLTYFSASLIYVVLYWMEIVQPIAEWRFLLILKGIIVLSLCIMTVNNMVKHFEKIGDKQSQDYYKELKNRYGFK